MPIINTVYPQAGTNTGDATATASQILSPYTAYVATGKVTGTMPTQTQATPSISVSSSGLITATYTQQTGYVSGGTETATQQLPTQGSATITPGSSQQTAVLSGRYTTGVIYVEGSQNLISSNIKQGVNIFGVTGNFSGNQLTWSATSVSGTIPQSNKTIIFHTGIGSLDGSKPYGFIVTQGSPISGELIDCVIGYSIFFPNNTIPINKYGVEQICAVFSSSGSTSIGTSWDDGSSSKGPTYSNISINSGVISIELKNEYVWNTSKSYSLWCLYSI